MMIDKKGVSNFRYFLVAACTWPQGTVPGCLAPCLTMILENC